MEKKKLRLEALTLVFVCLFAFSIFANVLGQENGDLDLAAQNARLMLTRLSAEEKGGQVFLVTVDGLSLQEDSPIIDLIQTYHLGGVILKKTNNNFTSSDQSLNDT